MWDHSEFVGSPGFCRVTPSLWDHPELWRHPKFVGSPVPVGSPRICRITPAGASPRICGITLSLWDHPQLWGHHARPSRCPRATPGRATPRCHSWLLHPDPVPNFVSFPRFREPLQRRKWWKILQNRCREPGSHRDPVLEGTPRAGGLVLCPLGDSSVVLGDTSGALATHPPR